MIDVDLRLSLADGARRFELATRFASDAAVVALYGASGAGKSLTLQAMAGLVQPSGGHVRVAGQTLYDAQAGVNLPAARRGVGYLFQHYALFPHLSVSQNVGFGLGHWLTGRLDASARHRVDELLAAFGLADMANSRISQLSGGQQQRVALARALACEPKVLLLDEPFAALNPLLRHSLRQELAAVRERWQVPMVMITHDLDDVVALADVAYVVDQGQVVREVDLRHAESRDLARRELLPEMPLPDARATALRRLLAGG